MVRISMKEYYDNKDVATQIYDLKDAMAENESIANAAKTASENASAAVTEFASTITEQNAKIQTASDKADAAQATADGFADSISTLETDTGTLKTDVAQLKISDAEHTESIASIESNISAHAEEITAIKAKDVAQDTEIQGLTESIVSDLTGSFNNTSRTLSLILERESAQSIDFSVVIPASSETGIYSPGTGIDITNNAISTKIDGTSIVMSNENMAVNTDIIPTKTYVSGVYATKSSAENLQLYKQNKIATTVVTLSASGWNNLSQTVSVTDVTADSIIWVTPTPNDFVAYGKAGVYASAQGNGTITFKCSTPPSTSMSVNVGVAN